MRRVPGRRQNTHTDGPGAEGAALERGGEAVPWLRLTGRYDVVRAVPAGKVETTADVVGMPMRLEDQVDARIALIEHGLDAIDVPRRVHDDRARAVHDDIAAVAETRGLDAVNLHL